MKYKKLKFLFIVLIFVSCNIDNEKLTQDEQEEYDILNDVGEIKYRKMAYNAINKGDTISYLKASRWYRMSRNFKDFFYFSNIMALKYNYAHAYYDNYLSYHKNYFYFAMEETANENDSSIIYSLLFNLAKAKELGYTFNRKFIGADTITADNVKSSQYYLERSFAE